ncbi:MAG: hypothetical protein ACE5H3_01415, partial [Planctomycetota bacterium]
TPLSLERMAGPEILAWLQAAGFRRLLRGGRIWAPKRGELPRAGDEVELDRLDPRGTEAAGRLRDVEHHARLLGGGEVVVRGPGGKTRRYRPGACRDCGRGGIVGPAPLETRLGGWTRERIREAPLWEALEHLEACSPRGNSFRRARDLLRGSSLMERPAGVPIGRLTFLERRLARLAGWLLFPLPGVVLLHDQPLSGFPVELAMRLGKALRAPGSGVHRFTDPEGFCAPSAAPSKGKPLEGLPRRGVEPFSLELDGTGWGDPPPCAGAMRLREALGLEAPLRDHFLRTEEARLRGWGRRDLARGPGGRICPQCRGRGGFSPHPALLLACPRCGGSGFGRETAVLEDRGLRWLDLGHQPLTGLRKHFSQTPRLAAVLRVAADLGLGGAPLDTPLFRLPLGARVLAPLAGRLAAGEAGSSLRLLAPAAGLTPLEAAKLLSRMQGYLSIMEDPVWKDHHPALLAALNRKH